MKTFVVAVFVITLFGLSSQQQVSPILQYRDECIKETGVDLTLVTRADQGDFVDDAKLKCFAKCFYQKQGFIDASGTLLSSAIESKIPATANKEDTVAIIKKCEALKGSDECDTAFQIHKCFFDFIRTQAISQAAAAQAAAAQAAAAQAEAAQAPSAPVETAPAESTTTKA